MSFFAICFQRAEHHLASRDRLDHQLTASEMRGWIGCLCFWDSSKWWFEGKHHRNEYCRVFQLRRNVRLFSHQIEKCYLLRLRWAAVPGLGAYSCTWRQLTCLTLDRVSLVIRVCTEPGDPWKPSLKVGPSQSLGKLAQLFWKTWPWWIAKVRRHGGKWALVHSCWQHGSHFQLVVLGSMIRFV